MACPTPEKAKTAPSRVAALLAHRSGRKTVEPGDRIEVGVDRLLLDGPSAAAILEVVAMEDRERGRPAPKSASRFLFIGGTEQPPDEAKKVEAFARKHHLPLSMDPQFSGFPGAVAVEEGLVESHHILVANRSEVGSLGGIGSLVLRADPLEMIGLFQSRRLEIEVPNTVVVEVFGGLPRWATPFDLAVAVIQEAGGVDTLKGSVLELYGDTVRGLSPAARLSLCESFAQLGLVGMIPPDKGTEIWLRARSTDRDGGKESAAPWARGFPEPSLRVDGSRTSSVAVLNAQTGRSVKVSDRPLKASDVVVHGRPEDLGLALEVIRERQIQSGIRLNWIPAERRSLLHAAERGMLADWFRAGGSVLPPGAAPPPLATGAKRVTTIISEGKDVLVGPVVAATVAIAGRAMTPEEMLREHPRVTARR